jgi:hypothetical protein
MRGITGGLADKLRWAARAARRATPHLDRNALAIVGDLALAHLGVPGTVSCSQYLTCRWRRLIATQCGHVLRMGRAGPGQRSHASDTTTKGAGSHVDA